MAKERLQKVLAAAGVASRRGSEELIAAGRVRVNGKIVKEMGVKVDAHKDKVELDGKRLVAEKPVYFVMHKPRKMVTTLDDPEGRDTIAELIGRIPERVHPIGRLDFHTSGALLLTNDGEMTEALLRPKKAVPKTYVAKVQGHLDVPELDQLRNGVTLDDGYVTKKAELFVIREEKNTTWVQVTLTEGKNRQIHRMFEALGHRVMRLSRTSFAGVETKGLRPGDLRPLTTKELDKLKKNYLNPQKRKKREEQIEQQGIDSGMAAPEPHGRPGSGRRSGRGAKGGPRRTKAKRGPERPKGKGAPKPEGGPAHPKGKGGPARPKGKGGPKPKGAPSRGPRRGKGSRGQR